MAIASSTLAEISSVTKPIRIGYFRHGWTDCLSGKGRTAAGEKGRMAARVKGRTGERERGSNTRFAHSPLLPFTLSPLHPLAPSRLPRRLHTLQNPLHVGK